MRKHPGTEIVSRDPSSLYAEATRKTLPRACNLGLVNLRDTHREIDMWAFRFLTHFGLHLHDKTRIQCTF